MQELVRAEQLLDEHIIKDVHAMLMDNIMIGGVYRNGPVRIGGASFRLPSAGELFYEIKNFYADMQWRINFMHPVEFAAWTHAEFVRIHPFFDGNGRISRMLMNYLLMYGGYLPVNVKKEERLEYYQALDRYGVEGVLDDFLRFVVQLEERELDQYLSLGQELGIIQYRKKKESVR